MEVVLFFISPVISRKMKIGRMMKITTTAICVKIKPVAKFLSKGKEVVW